MVDAVGGNILANLIPLIKDNGAIASYGLAQDFRLNTTVMPFILRGISLMGVNCVTVPNEQRVKVWNKYINFLNTEKVEYITDTIKLDKVFERSEYMINAQTHGRTVVDILSN